jgi:UDPglucose--hexose-1-phosphate uridylyltransferase
MSGAHRRFDPLSGRHVLVSPQRVTRPWQGHEEPGETAHPSRHDPACHLCPGNVRATGERNPDYGGIFVFDNDFAALTPEAAELPAADEPFLATPARGRSRVLCYSPDHGATLADLAPREIRAVVDAWCDQTAELGAAFTHVQPFENKGAMMGASSPHPHGQIWATDYLPDEVAREDRNQQEWLARRGRPLLVEIAEREAALRERVVVENDRWLAIVPFWAQWPFETLVLPRFAVSRLPELDPGARDELATVLSELTIRYDNLFRAPFPYSMGWHGAPYGDHRSESWQLHAHFYPPLLRSASVRKFMVGFELLAEAQRDLTPEAAAVRLRDAGVLLYRAPRQ